MHTLKYHPPVCTAKLSSSNGLCSVYVYIYMYFKYNYIYNPQGELRKTFNEGLTPILLSFECVFFFIHLYDSFIFILFRTDSRGQWGSSSSRTGLSKECQNREKASSISLARSIKRKSSLAKMGQSRSTVGKNGSSHWLRLPSTTHLHFKENKTLIQERWPLKW